MVHAYRLFVPGTFDPSPPWRHAAFVFINLAVAAGLLRPRRQWLLPLGVLVVQQLYSHGTSAVHAWLHQGEVDWTSLGILVLLPLTFGALWRVTEKF